MNALPTGPGITPSITKTFPSLERYWDVVDMVPSVTLTKMIKTTKNMIIGFFLEKK